MADYRKIAETLMNLGGQAVERGIRAYHGSPHKFDRFDISRIGTGEGAQSYGHGLYFAENEAVARDYRRRLGGAVPFLRGNEPVANSSVYDAAFEAAKPGLHPDQAGQITNQLLGLIEREGSAAKVAKEYAPPAGFEPQWQSALDAIGDVRWNKRPGHMYEVNIGAQPEQFIDWDRPLSAQGAGVRKFFEGEKFGAPVYPDTPGQHLPDFISPDRRVASEVLREAGIPGVRYLDQGSRTGKTALTQAQIEARLATLRDDIANAGARGVDPARMQQQAASLERDLQHFTNPTRNYVVFNDNLIDILKRYGIAAGITPTAAAAALSQGEGTQ